jgi:hypothetical protein
MKTYLKQFHSILQSSMTIFEHHFDVSLTEEPLELEPLLLCFNKCVDLV